MISGNYANNNIQANNIPYGAIKDVVPQNVNQKLPENLQNVDAKEIANSNDAVAAAGQIDKKSALLTLPIYASFIGLKEFYSTKGFAGEYGKTIPGKVAKAGDFISKGISKIIPDKIENGAKSGFSNAKNWLIEHSAIARSMTSPLKLENSTAIREANGIYSRVMLDLSEAFEKGNFGKGHKDLGIKELGEIFGKDTTFWKHLEDAGIKKASTSAEARQIVAKEINKLGEASLKDPKIKTFVEEIVENLGKSKEVIIRNKIGKLSLEKLKIFDTKISMSEMANKVRAISGINPKNATIGTTTLGKLLPKLFHINNEGLTSCTIGTKIAPILQAYFLAKAITEAAKAPKGKKLATFMDEETGMVTFMLTMPLATQILKSVGGAKYIGMDKLVKGAASNKEAQSAGVKMYRDAVKALNERVTAGSISRGEYVEEVKRVKDMLKGKVGDGKSAVRFWQKPFKAIGRILGSNFNKETIKPFIEAPSADAGKLKAFGINVSNKAQELLYKVKSGNNKLGNTPGGILRFGLVMFALSPLLSKPIKWCINKIFGKPYNEAEEKKEKEKKAKEEAIKNDPFKNMTQEELLKLLQKNQNKVAEVQNNPELMKELTTNPQKLYDFLQQGAAEYDKKEAGAKPSQMLESYKKNVQNGAMTNNAPMPSNNIVQPNAMQNPNNGLNNNMNLTMPAPSVQQPQAQPQMQEQNPVQQQNQLQRGYIPSSKPAENVVNAQNTENQKFNALMADMDNTEKEFSKYISM